MNCVNCSLWLGVCNGLEVASNVDSVVNPAVDKSSLESNIVEDEIGMDIVDKSMSRGVNNEVSTDVKEDAEHDDEALASGSARKQYASS